MAQLAEATAGCEVADADRVVEMAVHEGGSQVVRVDPSDEGPIIALRSEVDADAEPSGHLRAYERGLIVSALEAAGGNQRRAAAMLGLLPTTFHEKLKRYGLRPRAGEGDALTSYDEA